MNALQAALDAIDKANADDVTHYTAVALMRGYHERWQNQAWRTIAVEQQFRLPLVNPDSGKPSRTFTWAGKRDAVAEFDGRLYVVEHKTTSDDIADPDSTYWRTLKIDSQVSTYQLSAWQEGNKIAGTLYDVIRKPTIRPKQLPQKERAGIASLKRYMGGDVSEATVWAVVDGMDRENGELFGLRLESDIRENQAKYYQRQTLTRFDHELAEFATELWQIAQEIRETNNRGTHFRNSGACMLYGRPCEYLGICSGFDNPDSDKWIKANPHKELNEVADSALTNSRIRCYATCRRKHHYRYNLGLTRVDSEDAESLRFGSLLHVALEAWWECFTETNHVNGNNGHAVNEVACSDASQAELAE